MLDLIPGIMLVTFVVFIGLLVFLNTTLYKPLLSFMEQRDRTISLDSQKASEVTSESEVLLKEAEDILNKAKLEATEIRQSATEKAKETAEDIVSNKESELEKAYEEFLLKLEDEKTEAKTSVQSQLPLIKETIKAKFAQL